MGAGYILSWDLVTWLAVNRNDYYYNQWGEDQAVGEALRDGGKGSNFVNLGEQVMDHPWDKDSYWYREFGDDVILVHQLKGPWLKGDAIEYSFGRGRQNRGSHSV